MIEYAWRFEPCENEGPICDPQGSPWAHAVRGRKPARPMVMGYGHTPATADEDARRKAQEQDAREVLGQRGEVVTTLRISIRSLDAYRTMITVYDNATGEAIIQGPLVACDFYSPPPRMLPFGSILASYDMARQSIGT